MITREEADPIADEWVTQGPPAMLQRHFGLQLQPPDLSGPAACPEQSAGHG
jgi:hypothetical protein